MTIEVHNEAEREFLQACRNHDLTHEMSDDHSKWERGRRERGLISKLAHDLGDVRRVAEIWNAVVDEKMREGYREPFYWKVKS